MKPDEIIKLRQVMGTDPARAPERSDQIVVGCQGITVEMIDYPSNPYEAIFEGVTATWGDRMTWGHKWDRASPEGRLRTLLAVLSRKTLPEILEGPKFTFAIDGPSRACFDQFARHRIGVGINSVGTRDNNWLDASLRIPHEIDDDLEQLEAHRKAFFFAKEAYAYTVNTAKESWQSARFILPMGTTHRWIMTANYLALQNMSFQRMKFCEQFDTVGTMWLMWFEVHQEFPLLSAFMRPGCDWAKGCQYHQTYSLSELFGALFKGCGRHLVKDGEKYAEFNRACSTIGEVERDIGVLIPRPQEWGRIVYNAILDDPYLDIEGLEKKSIATLVKEVTGTDVE